VQHYLGIALLIYSVSMGDNKHYVHEKAFEFRQYASPYYVTDYTVVT